MVTIKRIRIKNFRSIVDETIELTKFNFFVGKNDSGKSNVLKALNLFFNEKTDFDAHFDFSTDYSKFAKRGKKQAKEIEISIDVIIPDSFKERGIKTWTKTWRDQGKHFDNIGSLFESNSKGITLLKRIKYMYIPAVKSNEFFKNLLVDVYGSMSKSANSALRELNDKYSKQLQELTSDLSEQIKNVLHINSAIQMPTDLNILFRDLKFSTSDKHIKAINLDQRGDGIKARHIPSILLYMQKTTELNRLKRSIGGSYIWGFEEPENGVEYSASFEMADELYSYCDKCQMLITTHSPAFYMKKECKNAKCYHVYKNTLGHSKYEIDVELDKLNEEIGILPLIAPYIKQEQEKYDKQQRKMAYDLKEITRKYKKIAGKIIILTEGKTDKKHIKFAFEQLKLDRELVNRIEYYDFKENEVLGEALGTLLVKMSNMPNVSKIIGIFDRDRHIQKPDRDKNYNVLGNNVFRFNIPALDNDERKEGDKICIEHYYTNNEIKVNTDFGHLYLGRDFNEYGCSNDGKWFFDGISKNNSITEISIIDGANKHIRKMCGDAMIITKDDFADYVINHPEEFDFKNFIKIFDVICAIDKENS